MTPIWGTPFSKLVGADIELASKTRHIEMVEAAFELAAAAETY